jgi:hypothetical protein
MFWREMRHFVVILLAKYGGQCSLHAWIGTKHMARGHTFLGNPSKRNSSNCQTCLDDTCTEDKTVFVAGGRGAQAEEAA